MWPVDDLVSSLQIMAEQYRSQYKLHPQFPLECRIPHWKAQELIGTYGSLEAAANALFDPGRVKLIDGYWQDWCWEMQERVNSRFARTPLLPDAPE